MGKRLKILVINTSTRISGAEKSLLDVLTTLYSFFEIIVVNPRNSEVREALQPCFTLETENLIQLKRRDGLLTTFINLNSILRTSYRISNLVRRHKIDIIYSNTSSAQLYAIFLKILTRKRLIWHVRDNSTSIVFKLLFVRFSDKIICVSSHILKQVSCVRKSELVYNGIDTKKWSPDHNISNKIKDELGIEGSAILVGHIGQLIPWKRHELFIEVAREILRDQGIKVHFVIIGDDLFNDFPEHQQGLRKMVKSSNLCKGISFLSYKDKLIEYLNGIDILLHMADNEPFGRVVIEAMALQKPVIARSEGGPKEIISDNCSGFLVNSSDPKIIAKKLRILINKPHLRTEFGRAGRRIVESKFSISNLQRMVSIISSMK